MSILPRLLSVVFLLVTLPCFAQKKVSATLIDSINNEPIYGATIQCTNSTCHCSCVSTTNGRFEMNCRDCSFIKISHTGYQSIILPIEKLLKAPGTLRLKPFAGSLNEIIVTASRGEKMKRTEAPIAIGLISAATIQETKAQSADQLLNKISG
ncbi:MAG: carboxypeptidase-like regulatory domain-containing protein, partial [Flavihumibacter sp.]|nr:carboxypeptidase-like regulatory domain-containing protein [Flavihumibacter sp.]